jgi:hypothetical protein
VQKLRPYLSTRLEMDAARRFAQGTSLRGNPTATFALAADYLLAVSSVFFDVSSGGLNEKFFLPACPRIAMTTAEPSVFASFCCIFICPATYSFSLLIELLNLVLGVGPLFGDPGQRLLLNERHFLLCLDRGAGSQSDYDSKEIPC